MFKENFLTDLKFAMCQNTSKKRSRSFNSNKVRNDLDNSVSLNQSTVNNELFDSNRLKYSSSVNNLNDMEDNYITNKTFITENANPEITKKRRDKEMQISIEYFENDCSAYASANGVQVKNSINDDNYSTRNSFKKNKKRYYYHL